MARTPHQTPDEFFKWLDIRMQDMGLNDQQLAKKAGIAPSVISKARSGYQGIGYDAACAIADALEIHPTVVMFRAKLLPPMTDGTSPESIEMNDLFSRLPLDEQEDLLGNARMKHSKVRNRGKRGTP
jgi:transcriptional regulator with XRE-family HTH domain